MVSPPSALTTFILFLAFEKRIDIIGRLTVSTTEVAILSIAITCLITRSKDIIKRFAMFLPLIAFILWIIVVSTISMDNLSTFKQGIRYIEGFLIFFVLYILIDRIDSEWINRIFLPIAIVISLIGIIQVFSPAIRQVFPPPQNNQPAIFVHDMVRAYSTFDHPNYLGIFLIPPMLLTIGLFLTSRKSYSGFVNLFILISTIFLTLSRGTWLILFVFVIIALCFIAKRYKVYASKFLILIVIIFVTTSTLLIIPTTRDNLIRRVEMSKPGEQSYLDLQRIQNFKAAFTMIEEKPITGWGAFSDNLIYMKEIGQRYSIVDFGKNIWGWANNIYLQVAVDFGIVGLILFMIMIIQIIIIAKKNISRRSIISQILFISFIALLCRGLMETLLARSLFIYTTTILLISNKVKQ
ncbi:MAG: hypothetical protein B6D57_00745 [Candidatus Coatesbacteria bacterium 4484_99]|uniref:O-antigen ligase-related domain-containing protein n=1 Tax=Candidatus Coatesbacteria bacterium 4484_99 TaxID=1970774 RepID=A0A1W9S370_9BACT|nr:MAG: hypothetical protein B6D57_00745 [Candidatus Coatesbacteria bacterium 4484_99]